ncbi:hypothetical protein ON010_g12427 [Phytophthora cinnamomi]|nr:hypothetical protein ON010_g12427 [Phytophthora cinnamomi]
MQSIRDETEQLSEAAQAKAAIFYSISSTQKGLSGVDLGNFLIKEVAKALKTEHPHLKTFATLSPLPQFMPWLETQRFKKDESLVSPLELDALIDVLEERDITAQPDSTAVAIVLDALSVDDWSADPDLVAVLKPIMLKLGARYIYHEKKRGKALDPVTNFHVRNGAIFERINWLADLSKKGLAQSAGMMINYKTSAAAGSRSAHYLNNGAKVDVVQLQSRQLLCSHFWRSVKGHISRSLESSEVKATMVLAQDEIDACREAFLAFDKDRSGTIDVWELRQVLEGKRSICGVFDAFLPISECLYAVAMGQQPTEEELFQMISEVDEDMSGAIDFAEFLQVIDNQKDRAAMFEDDSDMIDAFVACGGKPDKSGFVRKETLVKIIKGDFGLTINIEEMINKLDVDGSGEIEFDEFKAILT